MKRNAIVAGILVCLIVAGSVFAQGTIVTIGGSYWRGMVKGQTTISDESKAGNLFGPYINLRFDKVTLGGSWFFGKWDFGTANNTYELKRSDLNLSLGYSLSNNFTLFGAYKILKLTAKFDEEDYWTGATTTEEQEVWNVPYFGGGASLTFPFQNSPLFLFGSAAYLVHAKDEMTIKYLSQDYKTKVDDNITSFTVGLGARLDSGVSILAGYRADVHKAKNNDDEGAASLGGSEGLKINGLFATIAFTFRQ